MDTSEKSCLVQLENGGEGLCAECDNYFQYWSVVK